jgi:hypothetical protein
MGLKSQPVTGQAQSHPNVRRDVRLPGERRALGFVQPPRIVWLILWKCCNSALFFASGRRENKQFAREREI